MNKLILTYLFFTSVIRQINGEPEIGPEMPIVIRQINGEPDNGPGMPTVEHQINGDPDIGSWTQAMLKEVNSLRAEKDAAPLCYNFKLIIAAMRHNDDMVTNGFFSHTGSDGSSVASRVQDAGYSWGAVAENIALGQTSVEQVMEAWENSPGHYNNIINADVTHFGAAWNPTTNHWTQVFAKPLFSDSGEECVVFPPTCIDGELKMKIEVKETKVKRKRCKWIKPDNKEKRCTGNEEKGFVGLSSACPSTCGTCDTCEDTALEHRFMVKRQDGFKVGWKTCEWAYKDPETNCAFPGVSSMCRLTCGTCD